MQPTAPSEWLPKWLSNNFACGAIYFILHLKPNSIFTWSLFKVHSYRVSIPKKKKEKPMPPKSATTFLTVKCGLMQITFSKLNILKSGN